MGGRLVYVEATVISQTEDQERLQDLTLTSAYRPLTPDEQQETRELGCHDPEWRGGGNRATLQRRLSGDRQAGGEARTACAGAPNVICLGIADQDPDDPPVEWAIERCSPGQRPYWRFSWSRSRDFSTGMKGATPGCQGWACTGTPHGCRSIASALDAEPRLSAIAVYRWTGHRFDPHRIYRSLRPGPAQAVDAEQWRTLMAALGFGGDQERFLQ